jgi:hypothetical protein
MNSNPMKWRKVSSYKREMMKEVSTKTEFISVLKALRKDLEDNPDNWENKTLPDFLEALEAWIEDCEGFYESDNVEASWGLIADALQAAKIYE